MKIIIENKSYLYGLFLAFTGGGLANFIGIPLPWMLGLNCNRVFNSN